MVQFNAAQLEAVAASQPPYKGVKGSIVRLKVYDFMTYHKVELRAGPNVNLILGPNGTGKSTIVCAICIGLAGKPKILGRANSLKEYIRHDCNSASIEIELFNPDGDNFVVKRSIQASNTSAISTWFLNGKRCSQTQIEGLLSKLNIQLDNLCQFLPQDRVQEFSKMDSYSLLRSTQLAMGKDTLIQKHDKLIQLNELVKQIEHAVKNSSDSLRAEQQYNQRLENEVKNYHERERFKRIIADFKGKKAWIIYQKAVTSFSQSNSELEVLKQKKKEEESKLEPMKRSVRQMETKLGTYNREMVSCRNANVIKAVKTKYEEECDKIEVRVNEINSELEAVEKQEKDRQKQVDAATQKLNALTSDLDKFNAEGYNSDLARLEDDVRSITGEVTKLSESIYKVTEEKGSDEQEIQGLNERIRLWKREIERLGDLRVSRMKYMQREKKDAYAAVNFFEKPENRATLKGKINEPMILTISVNDLKYGPVVERHIGIADMTAFFCEEKDDLETMLAMMKPLNLRISIIHHEAPAANWQKPKPTLKPEYLRQFNFHKTLIELIHAPEYYLSYMTKKHRIHDIPIGKSPDTDRKFKDITSQTTIQAFYTDENSYFIKKSNYGNGVCSSVDFLPPARVFTTEINAAERERLEEQVREAAKTKSGIEERLKVRRAELQALEARRAVKEEELGVAKKKVEYKKQLVSKIAQAKRGKEQLERDVPDLKILREKAQKDTWNEREKLTAHLEWSVNEIEKHAKKGRQLIILKRQVSVLQSRIMTKQNLLEDLQASINQRNGELTTLSEQVKARAAEAERAKKEAIEVSQSSEPPNDVTEGNLTVEDINREITQAESQMGFLVDTDASIVKDYQERLKKIEKLNQERGTSISKLSDLKKEITQKKEEWLQPLQLLIDRINKNFGTFFENMGCAGEVSLCHTEDEDEFSKYGIKIMVQFRNSEPLAEMCGTRVGTLQSGGERVITTALYVLALQELTVVPFRVIDEINQGMDAKNESRFFNLLCSMAKGANTPQYFLLTPKMLPPVDYPDNVDFHFIMNGPKVNVPFDGGSSDAEDEGNDMEEDEEEDEEEDDSDDE